MVTTTNQMALLTSLQRIKIQDPFTNPYPYNTLHFNFRPHSLKKTYPETTTAEYRRWKREEVAEEIVTTLKGNEGKNNQILNSTSLNLWKVPSLLCNFL